MPNRWRQTVDQTLALWMQGVDNPRLERFLRTEMGTFGFEMWTRAAHNICDDYSSV
jgi:hypothetical protein